MHKIIHLYCLHSSSYPRLWLSLANTHGGLLTVPLFILWFTLQKVLQWFLLKTRKNLNPFTTSPLPFRYYCNLLPSVAHTAFSLLLHTSTLCHTPRCYLITGGVFLPGTFVCEWSLQIWYLLLMSPNCFTQACSDFGTVLSCIQTRFS